MLELLVVLGIMTLLVGISLPNLQQFRAQARVKAGVEQLNDLTKETRQKAVSVERFLPDIYPSYGIFFDTAHNKEVVIYADCVADDNNDDSITTNDSFTFDPRSRDCAKQNGLVETIALKEGAYIKTMYMTEPDSNGNGFITSEQTKASIEYLRPEPTIWLSNQNGTVVPVGELTVELSDTDNRATKTIVFLNSGQVYVK